MQTEKEKKVQEWYNKIAKTFIKRYESARGTYFSELEDKYIIERIDFKDKVVLDLGSGDGRFAFQIANIAKKVIGIDFSEEMIEIANFKKVQNTEFEVMNAQSMDFNDEFFDVVVSMGLFEYVDIFNPFFEEIYRVLKWNGYFIFTCHRKTKVRKMYYTLYYLISDLMKQRKNYYEPCEHSLQDIKMQLSNNSFHFIGYITTLYFPAPYWKILVKPLIKLSSFLTNTKIGACATEYIIFCQKRGYR